jgi:cystathionine beta-lyase
MKTQYRNPATACVHAGTCKDPITRGLNTPIYTSSSFEYLDRDVIPYPRYFNTPNQDAVVQKVCTLEGTESGLLFSSGMAAISTVILTFLKPGDHLVLQEDIYGGTYAFVVEECQRLNIDYSLAPAEADALCAQINERTRLLVLETPTNPLLKVLDMAKVAAAAKSRNVLTLVDSTFGTPILQQPALLGIDLVMHSGTKYLGGHSDLCFGIVTTTAALTKRLRYTAKNYGGSVNATTCALIERSLKTLSLRVERQTFNAGKIAEFLQTHPAMEQVHYPGLPQHSAHEIAKKQMSGFGPMLAFEPKASVIDSDKFLRQLKLITPALSLGHIETTACSPAKTSHVRMTREARLRVGVTDQLIRLSVGIEDVSDLIADLDQALKLQ